MGKQQAREAFVRDTISPTGENTLAAKIGKEFYIATREMMIHTKDLSFLTIIGADVTGAFAAFPQYGLSAKLSVYDTQYNTVQLCSMLPDEGNMWFPKDAEAQYRLAKVLSEAITPMLRDLYLDAVQRFEEKEHIEQVRQRAHEAGLPFSEKPWDGEEISPFVFDGSMDADDYEKMHSLREGAASETGKEVNSQGYKSFIEDCLRGEAALSDLHDYVEFWHTYETGKTLQEFLGMTDHEYEQWGKASDDIFSDIIRNRQESILNELASQETTTPDQSEAPPRGVSI